jgi:hypothetical protein
LLDGYDPAISPTPPNSSISSFTFFNQKEVYTIAENYAQTPAAE